MSQTRQKMACDKYNHNLINSNKSNHNPIKRMACDKSNLNLINSIIVGSMATNNINTKIWSSMTKSRWDISIKMDDPIRTSNNTKECRSIGTKKCTMRDITRSASRISTDRLAMQEVVMFNKNSIICIRNTLMIPITKVQQAFRAIQVKIDSRQWREVKHSTKS